jgi:AAA+ superfamily predicted ATPase
MTAGENTGGSMIRPPFFAELEAGYKLRRENIILLTGDVQGLFWSGSLGDFVSLDQFLEAELAPTFNMLRMDIANGLSFVDGSEGADGSSVEVPRVWESAGALDEKREEKVLVTQMEQTKHEPLPTLVVMKSITDAFIRRSFTEQKKVVGPETKKARPLCFVFQYAGALFPEGDAGRLSELDRQRLIFFLSWVQEPLFMKSPHLIILVSQTKAEVNAKLVGLPNTMHIEVQLPGEAERLAFIRMFAERSPKLTLDRGPEGLAADSAGLTLQHLRDILEVASRSGERITRKIVVDKVNEVLKAQLGDIIKVKYPEHTPENIIGYAETRAIFTETFRRCENSRTAISGIIVSGPNGGGKTFQLEAYAAQSGRVAIEIGNIRGQYYGQTDQLFELLRWYLATFGKILILVDEAHAAFGSVHGQDTHETEKRLAGNIIKMMGNPQLFGKILWGLMTSRPDELDPDIKSRAPVQIPIFDLQGDERRLYVRELFRREKIELSDEDLSKLIAETSYYSNRDFDNFRRECVAARENRPTITPIEVLEEWSASRSIVLQREFQELIALRHCSYPKLIPERLRTLTEEKIESRITELKRYLRY